MLIKPILNEVAKELAMINGLRVIAIDAEDIIDSKNIKGEFKV